VNSPQDFYATYKIIHTRTKVHHVLKQTETSV
jgi:hypothetical protein